MSQDLGFSPEPERLRHRTADSPLAVIEWDRTFRIAQWSSRAAEILGFGADDVRGRHVSEAGVMHPSDAARLADVVARLRPGAECWDLSLIRTFTKDGHELRCEWYTSALFDAEGRIAAVLTLLHDITRTLRRAELNACLAEASKRLAESLDFAATLHTVAGVAVGAFADFCRVDLLDAGGRVRTEALAHIVPERQQALARTLGRYPILIRYRGEQQLRLRGLPVFWPLGEPLVYAASNEEQGAQVFAGDASVMCAPMITHGSILGTLTLVRCDAARGFDETDRTFAAELAYRCALSIDHARLFAREHRVADTLQRAMLPASMPRVRGLAFSSAYSPAAAESEVGGDWYDAFMVSERQVAVSIGDVTGHGLTAAVVMGQVRQLIRAAAFGDPDPRNVLERANGMLVQHENAMIVTAIFGIVDAQAGTFTYATAGHPPPLLADSQGVRMLETAGLPLGLRGSEEAFMFCVDLEPGALLVLYTDGLIEFQRDIFGGEEALRDAVAAEYRARSRDPAQTIKERVLARTRQTDDIAMLVISVAPHPVRTSWILGAGDRAQAYRIRREVAEILREYAKPGSDTTAAEVATGELLANAVEHAPGEVEVTLDWSGDEALLIVGDLGKGVPTRSGPPDDPFAERGRGMFLLGELSRGYTIVREPLGGTRVMAILDIGRDPGQRVEGRNPTRPQPAS